MRRLPSFSPPTPTIAPASVESLIFVTKRTTTMLYCRKPHVIYSVFSTDETMSPILRVHVESTHQSAHQFHETKLRPKEAIMKKI